MELKNRRVLICGMARSGAACARALHTLGAELLLYDSRAFADLPEETKTVIENLPYEDYLGGDAGKAAQTADLLIVSPGLPPDLPFLLQAARHRIPVLAEMELGYRLAQADFVAVTGTNGKTTTTALTGEIFRRGWPKSYTLGNIGDPVTAHALATRPGEVIVAETAALQMDATIDFHPRASAILNITPDHLDRYGTMENYTEAKARIFKNQSGDDYCVLNRDDPLTVQLAPRVACRVLWFSLEPMTDEGVWLERGKILWRHHGSVRELMPAAGVRLPGRHNLQNAMCAAALALEYGIAPETVRRTLEEFAGVEHRIETVCEKDGVLYINDSKGTNPDATIKAVEAMTRPTVLILGGFDKHAEFGDLMQRLGPVRSIVVLGETAPKILRAAREAGFQNIRAVRDMAQAVKEAAAAADAGDAVLLSPACASWDMYKDFEERGRHFKKLVRDLS